MNLQQLSRLSYQHSYYCSESNYYSNECFHQFDSFDEYLKEWNDADLDYNMLFRWDLKQDDEGIFYLQLFFILQRKGIFMCEQVNNIQESDVNKILDYLKPRKEYIKKLWNN